MTEIFFKCTLISDVVLNSKLATEGNMTSLNYIPGSNFLGIVAGKLYQKITPEDAFEIFHSGAVSFGDGLPLLNNKFSYHIPFSLFVEKGKEIIGKDPAYQHHLLDKSIDELSTIQFQQKRNGFILPGGDFLKRVEKTFALKSAQDSLERKSKDGAMFGFEAIKSGQVFVFSIRFEKEAFIESIVDSVVGLKRIGKSKTAEYGQVHIEKMDKQPASINSLPNEKFTLVYAQSNLCFLDKYGQPTFQPPAEALGITGGQIDWKLSQIRTYSYSPWNGKRNTTDTQRDCIAMGSVFYVSGKTILTTNSVGEYQAEGLGRIIYNPEFLFHCEPSGKSNYFKELDVSKGHDDKDKMDNLEKALTTPTAFFLQQRLHSKNAELARSQYVQKKVNESCANGLDRVSSSQWGGIRAYAVDETDYERLYQKLLDKDKGVLRQGVAYSKYWGANKDYFLDKLQTVLSEGTPHGTLFVAKYAAEMAKRAQIRKEANHG